MGSTVVYKRGQMASSRFSDFFFFFARLRFMKDCLLKAFDISGFGGSELRVSFI